MTRDTDGIGLGGVMRDYRTAVDEGLIEPGILPLTEALHYTGAEPLSSCEGHEDGGNRLLNRILTFLNPRPRFQPFVLFRASEVYARAFHKEIGQLRGLFYHWALRGYFHPRGDELVWVIEIANDARFDRGEVDKTLIDADILLIATAVAVAHSQTRKADVHENQEAGSPS